MFIISAISIFFLVILGLGYVIHKYRPQLKAFFTTYPLALKALVWGYIIFNACFSFPISSSRFPLNFSKAYLLIVSYGAISYCFASIYKDKKPFSVLAHVFTFGSLGLVCRYFLEYGEISNSYNFTPTNIAAYLIIIPLYTVSAYMLLNKKLRK